MRASPLQFRKSCGHLKRRSLLVAALLCLSCSCSGDEGETHASQSLFLASDHIGFSLDIEQSLEPKKSNAFKRDPRLEEHAGSSDRNRYIAKGSYLDPDDDRLPQSVRQELSHPTGPYRALDLVVYKGQTIPGNALLVVPAAMVRQGGAHDIDLDESGGIHLVFVRTEVGSHRTSVEYRVGNAKKGEWTSHIELLAFATRPLGIHVRLLVLDKEALIILEVDSISPRSKERSLELFSISNTGTVTRWKITDGGAGTQAIEWGANGALILWTQHDSTIKDSYPSTFASFAIYYRKGRWSPVETLPIQATLEGASLSKQDDSAISVKCESSDVKMNQVEYLLKCEVSEK